jgi:hypothetical protein
VEQRQSPHPRWDEEVCERLVAGDEAALRELSDEFSPLVYGLAARVTRDWAAAEDLSQEVFVHVWNDPRAFDPARGTWRGWLGILTHRRAVDWVRRSVAKSVQAAVDDPLAPQRPPGAGRARRWRLDHLAGRPGSPDAPPGRHRHDGRPRLLLPARQPARPGLGPDRVEGDPVVAATLLRAAITLGCD